MVAPRIHQLLTRGRDWKKESLHLVVMFWKQIGQYTIYRVFFLSTWQNAVFIRLLFLIRRGMKASGSDFPPGGINDHDPVDCRSGQGLFGIWPRWQPAETPPLDGR